MPRQLRRRSVEAPKQHIGCAVPSDVRAAIAKAGETYGLADGTVAALAVERGLKSTVEMLRKRAGRAAGRGNGRADPTK